MAPRIPIIEGAEPGEIIHVTGPPSRHLQRALRMKKGDSVVLSDGEREYACTVGDATVAGIEVTVNEIHMPETESPLKLILAQAAVKGPKMDIIIEKATELGISDIIIFPSSRSGVNVGSSISRKDRWERIIRAATAQSGRVSSPSMNICQGIGPVFTAVDKIMDNYKTNNGDEIKILFWEEQTDSPLPKHKGTLHAACVMVGPEGGWAKEEVDKACNEGFEIAGLGPRTLRAETAAIVSISLMQATYGDLPRQI